MKQLFHRSDRLLCYDALTGEWYPAEVLRVTNANGFLYYVLRDLETNQVMHRIPPNEVKPIPGFLLIATDK
jgi:hypothetical protein